MLDERETFLHGVMEFVHAMGTVRLRSDKMTVVLSEEDGRKLEHILTQENMLVISEAVDPRYSQPKADNHVREFKVAGVTFQYRTKVLMLPNGKVL